MEHRRLGNSGLVVPSLGLGTNNFGTKLDRTATGRIIDAAIDHGITFFDTADSYGRGASETLIGELLGARRPDVMIATKFANSLDGTPARRGGSRRWLMQAVEASLRRLQTDYIDLYQVHFPDPATPFLETLQGLDDLVTAGKVRYIGTCNHAAWQLVDAQWTARTEHLTRPISAQHHVNLLERSTLAEVGPACEALGLGIIAFYPLASGFLTGKYRPDVTPADGRLADSPRRSAELLHDVNFERLARLEAFATERGRTILELAFGWILSQPQVTTAIASASSVEQLEQNLEAAAAWRLDTDELAAVAML